MKLGAFLVLANSTSAEPDVGTEMFCPFMGQKVPAFGSNTCTKWMQCPENRPGFSIVQECPSGVMFNKNTRECDETCTPDVCCLNPDAYVPPSTVQASTTAATQGLTTTFGSTQASTEAPTEVATGTPTDSPTGTPAAVNCFENNGGCSHYCNVSSQQCECPTCWVLGDDGITCDIDQSKIQVTCSDTGFDIEVDECIFIGDSNDDVTIGLMGHGNNMDLMCSSTNSTDGVHSIESELDSCGTKISYEDDEKLSFKNILEVTSRQFSNGIMFNNEVTIPVSCSFETHYHTDLATFGVDKNEIESGIVEGASAAATSFTFDLTLTTDHQLSEDLPEGFTRVIGDMNYFKIAPRHLPIGIEYEVTKCTVHDTNSNSFDIVSDSCPSQIVQGIVINGNPVSSIFGMGYRTFLFNSNESETDLSLSCDITVCTEGMCPGNSC